MKTRKVKFQYLEPILSIQLSIVRLHFWGNVRSICLVSLIGSSNRQEGEQETRRRGVHGRYRSVNGTSTDRSRDW